MSTCCIFLRAEIMEQLTTIGRFVESEQKSLRHPVRDGQSAAVWIQQLEPYLPSDLRDGATSKDITTNPPKNTETLDSEGEGESIATILGRARRLQGWDLLAYLGFTLQRWPAVYALITKMLDATERLQETLQSLEGTPSNLQWDLRDAKLGGKGSVVTGFKKSATSISMEAFTDEPRHSMANSAIMGEIWQSLGFIVLAAANKTAQESGLAMSYVYRTLAHLHESGNIPDAIYKFTSRSDNGSLYRPPAMYLLSTHIMNVLSDAAWLVHEAEVREKAQAAGEDSPFRSFKIGIRHLGPEIWLEFILWACVEQGHIKEGLWILKHLQGSNYGAAWKIVSWSPLLDHLKIINNTNIDKHDFWPHPDIPRTPEELQSKSGFFHGLGRLTISAEVFTALTTQAASYVNNDLRSDNSDVEDLIQQLASVNKMKPSYIDKEAASQSTGTYHIVPLLESHISESGMRPEWLEHVLTVLPPPIPPWDDAIPTDHQRLSALDEHDIRGASSLYAGLLQQNLRLYTQHQQVEKAMKTFNSLLEIIDSSKIDRIQEFWGKEKENEEAHQSESILPETSVLIDQSPIPTLSNGTLANLLDLIRVSKANDFGEWLLFSEDPDGPIISFESYGDQSLAPSILRFATATGNQGLGDLVVQRLQKPISRNTFNAIANFYIAFERWKEAEDILELLTQHRRKAWGETTLATLTSALLRLEQQIWEKPWEQELERSLAHVRILLRRFLLGYYNPERVFHEDVNMYYKKTIYRWHGLLLSIPGAVAQVANEVKPAYTNPQKRDILPFIPCVAFNLVLSAVVETRGSQAGMDMWKNWCIDIERSHAARLAEDETYRLQKSGDPITEELDIEFDWVWHRERQRKAVVPNLNTLRIISRAAVKELKESQADAPDKRTMSPSQQQTRDQIYKVLDFCVERYQRFNRDKYEIGRETSGHLKRIRMWQSRKRKNIVRWVYADIGQENDHHNMEDLLADNEDEEKDESD
ncbi:conserved hypothetical protein [Talaromyces stipitatus ATCC 10500]|uniref:Uncharacterized protein n=1 Tax=Talaromyces stipitatus (strain ATCC 10500 / CBS 375.48 / QM 6759 / NRRL 1006) TaxID=441959 RepID=B8M7H9_TALSN|nr:uncharacterized protein TSTA_028210 [Talaromyces stipitatus ATCC 10500]EED19532.1 conserved hypothetical protein [Talaromyces stipitatus ATCC 10500]